MKHRLFAVVATAVTLLATHPSKAGTEEGTLTLLGDKITFQTGDKAIVFTPLLTGQELPGAKVIKYEPKTITKGGKDTDVSELTVENQSDGRRIILVNATPIHVRHVTSTTSSSWNLITP